MTHTSFGDRACRLDDRHRGPLKPGYLHPGDGSDLAYTLKTLAVDATTGKVAWEHTV